MKMVKIEKCFVNRPQHAERVISRAEKLLHFVDIREGQRFLEVGCGNGAVSKYVAKKYPLGVTGIDVDPNQIRLAQASLDDNVDVHFLTVDATRLPFRDKDFDIVLSFGVTHHIANWLDAFEEIRRVLKHGGYFIYYDLIFTRLTAKLGRSFKHSYGITTMQDLNSFIEKNNFTALFTSTKNSPLWYNYEAVYRSGQ
jgi:ubiquinone/menaquinone biosynthesis C-methylase UbiE